ncbi:glycosyltransferase [Epilithonimonas sp.]|uniref:glycosyltransferase n=1 Tax=Epilithonimonas sp. TaxID=2894511 RepID=UPI0028989016|nr:glycosyltransferase [Epilithonimonas sp.]
MTTKRLFLFTRRFPYFKTEAFLESEIAFLAENFNEVIIIPTQVGDEIRQIPDNVKIDKNFSKEFQNKKKRILLTIFSSFFWRALWDHKDKLKGIKSIKHIFHFSTNVVIYKHFFKSFNFSDDDILYTYWFAEAVKGLIDIRQSNSGSYKIISRAHRYDIYEGMPATPEFWPYRKDVLSKIDQVFSISENGKKFLEEKYKILDKVCVSKLGVFDKNKIAPHPSSESLNIVSVSRVDPMKRVGLIADCIVAYASKHPGKNVVWTHFGDGVELPLIKSKIPVLPNLTINLNGAVHNSKIYEYYGNNPVSLFINLSNSEGIPVSIMEAQSFGIPAIATNVGGTGEIVITNKTGILLTSNPKEEDVINAINEILTNENFSREKVKCFWDKNYNAKLNYNEFLNLISKI